MRGVTGTVLYVHGSGGIGKSFAVLSQLKTQWVSSRSSHNTRLSGPAFFKLDWNSIP